MQASGESRELGCVCATPKRTRLGRRTIGDAKFLLGPGLDCLVAAAKLLTNHCELPGQALTGVFFGTKKLVVWEESGRPIISRGKELGYCAQPYCAGAKRFLARRFFDSIPAI